MTSIVDKYYRKISENIDNLKMKFDITALLVKTKEHDSKIDTNVSDISDNTSLIDTNKNNISSNTSLINTNKTDISDNTSLIDTNKNNISSNTSLIDTNKNNISSNTSLIDTNKNNISSNTSLIDTNKNNISSNTSLIDTNKNNISDNTSLIDTNKTDISDNTSLIDTNKNNISSNSNLIDTNKNNISSNSNLIDTNKNNISDNTSLINTNKNNISSNSNLINTNESDITKINNDLTNLKDGYKLKDIIMFKITNTNSQAVNKNNPSFVFFNDNINSFIKKDSFLEINLAIKTVFILHYINIGYFDIILKIYDHNNKLISSTKNLYIGMISKHAMISTICYVKLLNDYNSINLQLSIQLQENQNRNDIIKILDFDNFVYVKIFEKLDNSIHYEEFDV